MQSDVFDLIKDEAVLTVRRCEWRAAREIAEMNGWAPCTDTNYDSSGTTVCRYDARLMAAALRKAVKSKTLAMLFRRGGTVNVAKLNELNTVYNRVKDLPPEAAIPALKGLPQIAAEVREIVFLQQLARFCATGYGFSVENERLFACYSIDEGYDKLMAFLGRQ